MKTTLVTYTLLLASFCSLAQAQSPTAGPSALPEGPKPQQQETQKSTTSSAPVQAAPQKFIPRVLEDQWHIYKGPFSKQALPVNATFLAVTGVLIATDKYSADAVPMSGRNGSTAASNAIIGTEVLSAAGVWVGDWRRTIATRRNLGCYPLRRSPTAWWYMRSSIMQREESGLTRATTMETSSRIMP